jgi:valyl-tRNA synthetase
VLETVLRLLHPVAPFITAELWEQVAPLAGRKPPGATAGIVSAPYPQAELHRVDADADTWMARLKAVAGACRQLRSEMNLSPAERVPLLASGDGEFVTAAAPLLKALARLSEVRHLADDAAFDEATRSTPVAVQGEARLALLVAIDVEAEQARLAKELARIEAEIVKASAKLDNPSFVARAPAAVVSQEQQRLQDFKRTLDRLRDQAGRLRSSA